MKLFVAVTHNDWYRQLRRRPFLEEVNFWQPGVARRFQILEPGEPMLFKPHSPHHAIVGGGFFLYASELPCGLAWEFFRAANGAGDWRQMQRRIERARHLGRKASHQDYPISCIVLQSPFFFDEADWIPLPSDYSKNIGQGKTYDTTTPEGRRLWESVRVRLEALHPTGPAEPQGEMFGEAATLAPRLGPGAFQLVVLDSYQRRCAVSGDAVLSTLEVTHIRPIGKGGMHRLDNGLLLRADIRRLFDRGYLAIDSERRILVSPRLQAADPGAETYLALAESPLAVPEHPERRPRREFLAWHRSNIYQG